LEFFAFAKFGPTIFSIWEIFENEKTRSVFFEKSKIPTDRSDV